MKLCECGCGKPAPIAKMTNKKHCAVKGEQQRFILGHNFRSGENSYKYGKNGPENSNWKGGKYIDSCGYRLIYKKGHPRANCRGHVFEHILVAEKVLGKPLPLGSEIHHVDENRSNNNKDNLIICEDRAYHFLLHRRKRAYIACGRVDWAICPYCKQYDDPKNMYIYKNKHAGFHRGCRNKTR